MDIELWRGSENEVVTHSYVKMWWLTKFKGYRVALITERTRRNLLGRVVSTRFWTLDIVPEETV